MSGIYNNWIKVTHQNLPNDIIPMMSNGDQTPFYFGGSQIPDTIGYKKTVQGKGFISSSNIPKISQGVKTQVPYYEKQTRILLPRVLTRK
jgi:hypothetical protein